MTTGIDVTLAGLYQLQERIDHQQLEEGDWPVVGALVSKLIERTEGRLARLKGKADQQKKSQQSEESPNNGVESSSHAEDDYDSDEGDSSDDAAGQDQPTGDESRDPPKKGHGRNGAGAFHNATKVFHALAAGIIGAICTACGKGTVFPYRDKVILRVVGQSLFGAFRHHFEQGRCRLCGAIFTAQGTELIVREGIGTSYITYGWSACAMLIVMHYFAGAPFKRLEALHHGWGVPMPDANQWRIVDECDDLLAPLFKAIEKHAIKNATNLGFDDTGSTIIEVRRQIQQEIQVLEQLGESTKHVRTGINASCIHLETPAGKVVLFYTGRHHAAEMVDRLLEHRRTSAEKVITASDEKIIAISDAASKNFSLSHADELEQAACNAHCFLKFRTIKNQFPAEYALAGEVYDKVFANEDKAKALGLNPQARMLYHRKHSQPLMLRLWQMCKDKVDGKLVEPNSLLWEPVSYVINQWSRLTKFYEVPGVPLDSNFVEQDLIIPVRYLAGSFAYQTETGAEVGDRAMSLIATANVNGVEPVAYLTECLRNHEDLARRPEYYLPWVYRDRLQELDVSQQTQGPAPSRPSPTPAQEVRHPLRPGTHRSSAPVHPPP